MLRKTSGEQISSLKFSLTSSELQQVLPLGYVNFYFSAVGEAIDLSMNMATECPVFFDR
jgi:hypothetical protein